MAVKNYPVGTHFSGPIKLGTKSMLLSTEVGGISAAKTLTADESNGMTYILDGGTGVGITLPAPTKGWRCKFVIGAAFGTDFVFTAGTADTFEGCVIEAGAVQDVDAADTITLEDGTENIGDWIEFWSDGNKTYTFGNFLTGSSVTVAG